MCKPVARGGDPRCQDAIVITNRALVKGDFLTQMARVLSLHPHAVILREKDLPDAAYEALARALLPMCRAAQVPCFLHGHIALAQKLGCRRIHLPLAALEQQMLGASTVETSSIECLPQKQPGARLHTQLAEADERRAQRASESDSCAGKPRLQDLFDEISVSCHSMEDVQRAVAGGATQIVLGTIFETECKRGLKGRGLDFVREVTAACPIPVYAIGGITLERIPLVQHAGAAGGCMMSGFMTM